MKAAVFRVDSSVAAGGNGQSWDTAILKIQDAVNLATAGDEIWVAAGVYHEALFLHEGISLFGGFIGTETSRLQRNWNVHSSILNGDDSRRVVNLPYHASIPTRLDGFVIRNGQADFGAGIYSAGGEFVSANNLIIHNNGDGIFGGGGLFADETVQLANESPLTFFMNVANRLLQLNSPELSAGRIQIFPTNEYTPEVHRILQVAVNIYDATTNRGTSYPFYPTVFRPVFTNESGSIFISGFVEATNSDFLTNQWLDKTSSENRDLLNDSSLASNANIYGQPIIIGAKKGFPNFNEFSMETFAQVTRLLEVRKQTTNFPPVFTQTNQMYLFGFTNIFGVESWNSYSQNFPRPLTLHVSHTFTASITDENGAIIWPVNGTALITNFTPTIVVSNWTGTSVFGNPSTNSFALPLFTNISTLPLSQYFNSSPHFQSQTPSFETDVGFPIPKWILNLTNNVQYFAVDAGRVVDFVNLNPVITRINIDGELFGIGFPSSWPGEPSIVVSCWKTNRLGGSTNIASPTLGILNQINVSLYAFPLSETDWVSFNGISGLVGPVREHAIDNFRKFMGFTPIYSPNSAMPPYTITQAPFAPTRKIYHRLRLQANDPLVHFLTEDLRDATNPDLAFAIIPPVGASPPTSNLHRLNERYQPFGFISENFYNPLFEDAGIHRSQDWDFPTNNLFNLQWLDRVHRGTPWQTVFTGFDASLLNENKKADWLAWSGSSETYPTNDWKIAELLLSERASLGTIIATDSPVFVNNTFAANTGIEGAGASFAASATFLNNIIAENSSGLFRLPVTNEVMFQTNCIFNNAQYNFSNLSSGSGNIAANPQFVSAGNDNFHLLATSPCINAGSDDAFAHGWLLDEPERTHGIGVDLGAFELSPLDMPVFVSPTFSATLNQFTFQVTGFTGERFRVEISDDLLHWIPFSTNTTSNGFFSLSNEFIGASNRFYRAVHVP